MGNLTSAMPIAAAEGASFGPTSVAYTNVVQGSTGAPQSSLIFTEGSLKAGNLKLANGIFGKVKGSDGTLKELYQSRNQMALSKNRQLIQSTNSLTIVDANRLFVLQKSVFQAFPQSQRVALNTNLQSFSTINGSRAYSDATALPFAAQQPTISPICQIKDQSRSVTGLRPPSPQTELTKLYCLEPKDTTSIVEMVAARLTSLRAVHHLQLHSHILLPHRISFGDPIEKTGLGGKLPSFTRFWMSQSVSQRIKEVPVLLEIEKYWFVFQMLCALAELHSLGVAHGSLSLSNFLVSGFGLLMLTDIGSCYKPYLLDLATASTAAALYFETKESHSLKLKSSYLSPERFVSGVPPFRNSSEVLNAAVTLHERTADTPLQQALSKNQINVSHSEGEQMSAHLKVDNSLEISGTSKDTMIEVDGETLPESVSPMSRNDSSAVSEHNCSTPPCEVNVGNANWIASPSSPEANTGHHRLQQKNERPAGLHTLRFVNNVYSSDIYSLGCCIGELFCRGQSVMTFQDTVQLSKRLDYTSNPFKVSSVCVDSPEPKNVNSAFCDIKYVHKTKPLKSQPSDKVSFYGSGVQSIPDVSDFRNLPPEFELINNPKILSLVSTMCSLDPETRPSAVACLLLGRLLGIFPDYFFTLYLPLFNTLTHPYLQHPDMALIYLASFCSNLSSQPQILPSRPKDVSKDLQHERSTISSINSTNSETSESILLNNRNLTKQCISQSTASEGKRRKFVESRRSDSSVGSLDIVQKCKVIRNRSKPKKGCRRREKSILSSLLIFDAFIDSLGFLPLHCFRSHSLRSHVKRVRHSQSACHVSQSQRQSRSSAGTLSSNVPNDLVYEMADISPSQAPPRSSTENPPFQKELLHHSISNPVLTTTSSAATDVALTSRTDTSNENFCGHNPIPSGESLRFDGSLLRKATKSSEKQSRRYRRSSPSVLKFMNLWSTKRHIRRSCIKENIDRFCLNSKTPRRQFRRRTSTRNVKRFLVWLREAANQSNAFDLPFPTISTASGTFFSDALINFWGASYKHALETINERSDVWKIDDHWGVFMWPQSRLLKSSEVIMHHLTQQLFQFWCNLSFKSHSAAGLSLLTEPHLTSNLSNESSSQPRHCLPKTDAFSNKLSQSFLTGDALVILIHLLGSNLVNSNMKDVQILGLQLLCQIATSKTDQNAQFVSSKVIFHRILPILCHFFESKDHSLKCKALNHLCQICSFLNWVDVPKSFIPDCLFIPIQQMAITTNPLMTLTASHSIPILLKVLSKIVKIDENAESSQSIRSRITRFLHPLLSCGYSKLRIAILRSCGSLRRLLSDRVILDLLLPFLISFLNAPSPDVRIAFCLYAFNLLPLTSSSKQIRETLRDQRIENSSLRSNEKIQTDDRNMTQSHQNVESVQSPWRACLTMSAALFPCFEGALTDADEMVVEAALFGLTKCFSKYLPRFLKNVFHVKRDPDSLNTSKILFCIRLRRQSKDLHPKVCRLSIHPNVKIRQMSIRLLDTMRQTFFDAKTSLESKAVNQFSEHFSNERIPTYLTRYEMYHLALNGSMPCKMTPCQQVELFLVHIRQTMKPSILSDLSFLRSFQKKGGVGEFDTTNSQFGFLTKKKSILMSNEIDTIATAMSMSSDQYRSEVPINQHNCVINSSKKPIFNTLMRTELPATTEITENICFANFFLSNQSCHNDSTYHHKSLESHLFDSPSHNLVFFNLWSSKKIKTQIKRAQIISRQICSDVTPKERSSRLESLARILYDNNFFEGEKADLIQYINGGVDVKKWVFRDWRVRALGLPATHLNFKDQTSQQGVKAQQNCRTLASSCTAKVTSRESTDFGTSDSRKVQQEQLSQSNFINQNPIINLIKDEQSITDPAKYKAVDNISGTETRNALNQSRMNSKLCSLLPTAEHLINISRLQSISTHLLNEVESTNAEVALQSDSGKASHLSHLHRIAEAFRPRGILCGVIYRHEYSTKEFPGRSLHLDCTADGTLMISGYKGRQIRGLFQSDRRQSTKNHFFVWRTSSLLATAQQSCLEFIQIDKAPTYFKVFESKKSILVGTERGELLCVPIDSSVGSSSHMKKSNRKHFTEDSYELGKPTANHGISTWAFSGPSDHTKSFQDVIEIKTFETSFEHVVCSIHRDGQIRCVDIRCPKLSSQFVIPEWMGSPKCLSIAPSNHFLIVGTLGGYLITYDLRYQLPIQVLHATLYGFAVSIISCSQSSISSTSVFVTLGTDRNEICSVDPLSGIIEWIFISKNIMTDPENNSNPSEVFFSQQSLNSFNDFSLNSQEQGSDHQNSYLDQPLQQQPLPIFKPVDLKFMSNSNSPEPSDLSNYQMILHNVEFGSNGNLLTVWTPDNTNYVPQINLMNNQLNKLECQSEDLMSLMLSSSPNKSKMTGLLVAGTDRRLRCLDTVKTYKHSYVVFGQSEGDSYSYQPVPICNLSQNEASSFQYDISTSPDSKLPTSPSINVPINKMNWCLSPMMTIELIYSESKMFTIKEKHMRKCHEFTKRLSNPLLGKNSSSSRRHACEVSLADNLNTAKTYKCDNKVFFHIQMNRLRHYSVPSTPASLQRIDLGLAGKEGTDTCHNDTITSILVLPSSKHFHFNDSETSSDFFLTTASKDGIIKIWR